MREVTDRRGWTLGALALLLGLLALAAAPTVAAANVAPQCQTGINSQVLRTGKPSTVQVFCSDPDNQPLTIQATTPDHGTLSSFAYNGDLDAYEATFTPAGSYTGPDGFAFVATDGSAFSPSYGFELVITENHAPRCEPTGAVHTKVGEPVEAQVFCSDGDIQDQNLTSATRCSSCARAPLATARSAPARPRRSATRRRPTTSAPTASPTARATTAASTRPPPRSGSRSSRARRRPATTPRRSPYAPTRREASA